MGWPRRRTLCGSDFELPLVVTSSDSTKENRSRSIGREVMSFSIYCSNGTVAILELTISVYHKNATSSSDAPCSFQLPITIGSIEK